MRSSFRMMLEEIEMTQNTPHLWNLFRTEDTKVKAHIKHELRHLESRLNRAMARKELSGPEMTHLFTNLACRYLDYLKIIEPEKEYTFSDSLGDCQVKLADCYSLIQNYQHQLFINPNLQHESKLVVDIATLYFQCAKISDGSDDSLDTLSNQLMIPDKLKSIFMTQNSLESWLLALVDVWNQSHHDGQDLSLLFKDWTLIEQQYMLDFFSETTLVDLVNAIFFYKLYPDKLFAELIHPEKLISVRTRLGLLHEYIELLQHHAYQVAQQHGLKPGVDYLFHGDELPQGIMIEVNDEYCLMIKHAIKKLKVGFSEENEDKAIVERLLDLGRAYKFWFNPNRLIDAVMVLQQCLLKDQVKTDLLLFQQEMVMIYGRLTTTQCLDLYGYFANNDSRYLMYTLFSIIENKPLDWLPQLTAIEKNAIITVFHALQCVMEALRSELKNRHVTTDSYVYDLGKDQVQARRRNRDAVFRILAIYGSETITMNETVEKMFSFIEDRD